VVLIALTVVVVEVARWRQPRARLFADPFYYSLADAIQADDVQRAYGFLRTGRDPSDLIAVRDPALTRDRWILVSPLLWAVATQRKNEVLMLLGIGARTDRGTDRAASCLADALGNVEIAALLRKYRNTLAFDQCMAPKDRDAPFLSLVEQSGQ